jgi:hypothetical protein
MLAALLRRASFANVIAFTALFVALGGGAFAAVSGIPGRDGVIHTCFKKRGGALRVVPAGAHCGKKQKALAINQRGPQGVPGPKGETGTVDTSAFYSKADSDNRFLQGKGHLIVAPAVDYARGEIPTTPIIEVPGVGKVEMFACDDPGQANTTRIDYRNTSSAAEDLFQVEEHGVSVASGSNLLDPDQAKPTLDMGTGGGLVRTYVHTATAQVEITTVYETLAGPACRFWARAEVLGA